MASNQNFDGSGFLFGSTLVGADGFLKCHGVYLGSAFGTSTPSYIVDHDLVISFLFFSCK